MKNNKNNKDGSIQLLGISYDQNTGHYNVSIPKGSNAAETAFCVSVIIKVFDRDKIVSKEEFLKLVDKYLNDSQFEEVKEDKNEPSKEN